MTRGHVRRWMEEGRRVLQVRGTFDGEAAYELLRELRRDPEQEVVIDLGDVGGFDEVGVAALARLVERGGGWRVALRGLSLRQLRILRHLGASLSAVGAEAGP